MKGQLPPPPFFTLLGLNYVVRQNSEHRLNVDVSSIYSVTTQQRRVVQLTV